MKSINDMNEEELRALNKEVVARIRYLGTMDAMKAIGNFHVGQLVTFKNSKSPWAVPILCKITGLNQKTVSATEAGTGKPWRIHASFLTAAPEGATA
jgi:hypothetical protein